jgi:hypothetical protein
MWKPGRKEPGNPPMLFKSRDFAAKLGHSKMLKD